jgi:hypothetical protein
MVEAGPALEAPERSPVLVLGCFARTFAIRRQPSGAVTTNRSVLIADGGERER